MTSKLFFLYLALICGAEAHKILGVFPTMSKSHYILGSAIMKKLAAEGHEVCLVTHVQIGAVYYRDLNTLKLFQVTVLTPFPGKSKIDNFNEVLVDGLREQFESKMTLQI